MKSSNMPGKNSLNGPKGNIDGILRDRTTYERSGRLSYRAAISLGGARTSETALRTS